jgi:hypothetical protein
MIDPISAFSIITTVSGSISSAVKAGRDLSSLAPKIKKIAEAEAELQYGASRKKNSILSKIKGSDAGAIDEFFKKEEMRQAYDKLRETVQLYGSMGQWERLSAEIARHRTMHKNMLEHRAKQKRQLITFIVGTAASLGMIAVIVGFLFTLKTFT